MAATASLIDMALGLSLFSARFGQLEYQPGDLDCTSHSIFTSCEARGSLYPFFFILNNPRLILCPNFIGPQLATLKEGEKFKYSTFRDRNLKAAHWFSIFFDEIFDIKHCSHFRQKTICPSSRYRRTSIKASLAKNVEQRR